MFAYLTSIAKQLHQILKIPNHNLMTEIMNSHQQLDY